MRSKKGKEWERQQMEARYGSDRAYRAYKSSARSMNPKFLLFSKIWAVVYIVLLALFIFTLFMADILPLVVLIPLAVILVIASFFLIPELLLDNIKKHRKIIAVVIATVLIPIFAYGAIGLGSVAGFFSAITGNSSETMTF